jgi:hypothetical protein
MKKLLTPFVYGYNFIKYFLTVINIFSHFAKLPINVKAVFILIAVSYVFILGAAMLASYYYTLHPAVWYVNVIYVGCVLTSILGIYSLYVALRDGGA